jgi:hypothetical protein
MPAAQRPAGFVGRQQELATLCAHLAAARTGQGGLVLLAGEPGIGKTRLLAEFTQQARTDGSLVLLGRSYDGEGMPPYLPFVEALRGYVRGRPPELLAMQLGPSAGEVALLVPELGERLPDLPSRQPIAAEHERYRLFESVTDFLLAIARSTASGLVLLLDDLHWADAPSLLLLLHLARRCAEAPLLVVGAYRTTELARAHPLAAVLAELRRERLAERLALGALAAEETETLVAGLAGVTPAAALAATVQQQTGGNAFFVEEVVRQLLAEGCDLTECGDAIAVWDLPEGVREVVGHRLSRLSDTANRLLQYTAVLGVGAATPVLAAATGLAWDSLTTALEECSGAGLLREEAGGYSFTHALIQQTVLEELSLPRRQRLHLEAAAAIERTRAGDVAPHAAALATHYRLAGALAVPDYALRAMRLAAAAAERVFAWEDAVSHLQAAVDVLDADVASDAAERCDLLITLGEAQGKAGDMYGAQRTIARAVPEARALSGPARLARAALGSAPVWGTWPDKQAARELLEEIAQLLPGDDAALRARVLARLVIVEIELRATPDWNERCVALSEEAVAVARRSGDAVVLFFALEALWSALAFSPLQVQRCLEIANELVHVAERCDDRALAPHARGARIYQFIALGERDAFDADLAEFDSRTQALRQPAYRWTALVPKSMAAVLDGRFDESERLATEALRIGKPAHGEAAIAIYRDQMFALAQQRGRLHELEAMCRERAEQDDRSGYRAELALLYCELGRTAEAQRELDQLMVDDVSRWARPRACAVGAAQACVMLGDRRTAEPLYAVLEPSAGLNLNSLWAACCLGPACFYLGLLAATLHRWDDAERHFVDALAMTRRLRDRPHEAHVLRAHGEMLLARRRREDLPHAYALLAEAVARYERLDMLHFADKARVLLTAASPMPAPPPTIPTASPSVRWRCCGWSQRARATARSPSGS